MKLSPYRTRHAKINSKWIKLLNVRLETVRLLEENIQRKAFGIGLCSMFCGFDIKGKAAEAKTSQWDDTKLRPFSRAEGTICNIKRQPMK